MTLYSFCVKKKGEDKYVPLREQHNLPFLDYMVSKFNTEAELLYFLGIDSEKYDSLRLMNCETKKTLPLIFADDMAESAEHLIALPRELISDCYTNLANIYYNHDREPVCFKEVDEMEYICSQVGFWPVINPDIKFLLNEIIGKMEALFHSIKQEFKDMPDSYIWHAATEMEAIKEYDDDEYESFENRLMMMYEEVRELNLQMVKDGHLEPKISKKQVPRITARKILKEQLVYHDFYYNLHKNMTELEESESLRNIFIKMMCGDEEAFKAYEALDEATKEKYKPLMKLVELVRGKAKKMGTID